MLEGQSTTSWFWSLSNSYVLDYYISIGIDSTGATPFAMHDLNGLTFPTILAGSKYFVAREGDVRPYGYNDDSLAKTADGTRSVYKSSNPLPMGYVYDSVITTEGFNDLFPEQKREALMQACIVEGDSSELPQANVAFSSKLIPYEIECSKGVEYSQGTFTVSKKGAKAVFLLDAPSDSETFIEFGNFEHYTSAEAPYATLTFSYEDGIVVSRSFYCVGPLSKYYVYRPWRTVCAGYSSSPLKSITFEFPERGSYSFDDLRVISQSMDACDQYVSGLTEHTLVDVDMHYLGKRSAATTYVTGTITLDERGILCTQIPYSDGWRVVVDDVEADLVRVNTMFCGVELSSGIHRIEFQYETPGLKVGILLAIAGILGIIIVAMVRRSRRVLLRAFSAPPTRFSSARPNRPQNSWRMPAPPGM